MGVSERRAERPGTGERALRVLPGGGGSRAEVAVIDLGSNSWRAVAYRSTAAGRWARTGQLQEPVRIAQGLERTGSIGEPALVRGLETLAMFARWCTARGIDRDAVDVVATSAIRDAANGDEVVARASRASGLAVRVLSAAEEARFGFLAAVNTTTLEDGMALDLGGGSLQLVAVRDRESRGFGSWPLGAVRVTDRLLAGDRAVSRKQLKRARAAVVEQLSELPGPKRGDRIVAMGGAVRNLAAAHQRARGIDAAGIQGQRLSAGDVRSLVGALASRPAAARALPGIKPARADVILAAALVLEVVLERTGLTALEVTRAGLREGVLLDRRVERPLVPDVRGAAIDALAAECRVDLKHAAHVAALALDLHDSMVARGVFTATADERELLHAAAMLHEVGAVVSEDGQATHGRYVILNAGLPGHAPREVTLIAQIVRHQRKGAPDSEDLGALTHPGDGDAVRRCALLLRLADELDSAGDRAVRSARVVADRRRLHLELTGDAALASWRVRRQLADGELRRAFGRPLVLAA